MWLTEDPSAQIALVGDWNIAPTDEDVWSVEFFRGSTHVTEPERAAFNAMTEARFTDVVRPFTPGPAVYTYWDYTQLRFPKNRGMRIDFILGSPALAQRVTHAEIVRDERKGKGAERPRTGASGTPRRLACPGKRRGSGGTGADVAGPERIPAPPPVRHRRVLAIDQGDDVATPLPRRGKPFRVRAPRRGAPSRHRTTAARNRR